MTDITKKFKEIELKSPKLLLHISGKVHNLHGRYATRPQEIHSTVYSQTDAVETEKEQTAKMAKVSRAKQVDVHTFPRNGTNQIVAPLGGAHGYLKGALLSSTVKYGDTSKKTSPAYGVKKKLQQGVFIEPDWIALGDTFSNPVDEPAGFFITKIGQTEYYDFVREVPIEFTLRVESDISEDIMLSLLAFMQRLGIGPKRRGLLKIEKIEKL